MHRRTSSGELGNPSSRQTGRSYFPATGKQTMRIETDGRTETRARQLDFAAGGVGRSVCLRPASGTDLIEVHRVRRMAPSLYLPSVQLARASRPVLRLCRRGAARNRRRRPPALIENTRAPSDEQLQRADSGLLVASKQPAPSLVSSPFSSLYNVRSAGQQPNDKKFSSVFGYSVGGARAQSTSGLVAAISSLDTRLIRPYVFRRAVFPALRPASRYYSTCTGNWNVDTSCGDDSGHTNRD